LIDITSCINFARLVISKSAIKYDLTSYVLGAIAPNAGKDPTNDSTYRLRHFVVGETNPDLAFFLEATRHLRNKSNISERSFVDGYYAHLWLDNYMRNYGEDIRLIHQLNLTPKQIKTYFKQNIRHYNLVAIRDFVTEVRTPMLKIREIPGLYFISIDAAIILWNQFVELFKKFDETEPMTVIITKEQHDRFLEKTATEFAKTYNTIFKESVGWEVPNYCRM
jgi:hypothetical protein